VRLRIKPTIMAATACLVVVTTAGVAIATNVIGSRVVEDLVDRRFRTIAESAATEVSGLVGAAVGVLREQRILAAQDALPLDDSTALGRRFAERLRQASQLAWISYGDPKGDRFVGVTRRPDGSVMINHSEAEIDAGVPHEAVAKPDGTWIALPAFKKPYSVVGQRWFTDALATDDIVVTGPYRFSEGVMGLTLSARWRDRLNQPRGVFTVDFFLDDLSRGLAALVGEDGDAVLLDANGNLLARAGAVRPPDLVSAAVAVLAARRAEFLPLPFGRSLSVDVASPDDKGGLRASLTRLDVGLNVEWILVLLQSHDTLFAPLRKLHIAILATSGAVVLLGLVGALLLATRLARPLDALSAEAEKIRNFELDDPVEARSSIVELASLIEAMSAMKAGLRSFGRFVPKRVVKRLIAAGGAATLGGERRELTLMFSDIAGFTSTSEGMTPEQVMRRISDYFDAMSDAIHDQQGIVDKYIGDAIMAIWNAPKRDGDHAANACRALLACMQANDALDDKARADGIPALPTRFGVHTGEAVIGNIGSTDRMQYTALGANVNLASRLEPLNKRYGTRNLVSVETKVRAGAEFLFRTVAIVQPAGTTRPIEVFELLGSAQDADAERLRTRIARWEDALAALRAGRTKDALAMFEAIAAERPAGGLAKFYVKRCAELLRRTEPWDGTDDFSEK
jgi:adenylate cyclase